MDTVLTKELKPHHLNESIYGDRADSDLVESVKEKGIYNPLLITHDQRIISGHRRWGAANAAGVESVPVVWFESDDELDIEEALIESNRQREKTNEQKGREFYELERIYNERESRQGSNQYIDKDGASDRKRSEAKEDMRPSRKAAEAIGIGYTAANQAKQVVTVIDKLEETDNQAADELRTTLNKSINGAYKAAKAAGYIEVKPSKPAPQVRNFITLQEWQGMIREDQVKAIHVNGDKGFNSTNENVEWALWTWNPVTGCLHDCPYCYARDIAKRFYSHLGAEDERFQPALYPERLNAPYITNQPDLSSIDDPVKRLGNKNVFVCSMADLFGKWVPKQWIDAVLNQVRNNPQWNFLFLTKFPIRMAEFEYPDNAWIGTTVDRQWAVDRAEKAFAKVRDTGYNGIAWLSCEPMMERLEFSRLDMFDWVVVGGSSKSTRTPEFKPPIEWTINLYNQAKAYDLPVYMKTNLGIENEIRLREYPYESVS